MSRRFIPSLLLFSALAGLTLAGCDNMAVQPRPKGYRPADDTTSRKVWPPTPPDHTIARDDVARPPPALNQALLERGHQRFDIYCAPCHGYGGDADGMVVQRGFPTPPSFHSDRLRGAPTSHFVDVITNGWGAMYSYADRVPSDDRWAIAAYIRALQDSRTVSVADLPNSIRKGLK